MCILVNLESTTGLIVPNQKDNFTTEESDCRKTNENQKNSTDSNSAINTIEWKIIVKNFFPSTTTSEINLMIKAGIEKN